MPRSMRTVQFRGRMAPEGLYVPVHRGELLSFPAGEHDDQVDALGLIAQLLDKMTLGNKPKKDLELSRDGELREQIRDDVLTL